MPVIDVAHQHLITARAIHSIQKREGKPVVGTLDWSGIIAGSRVAAGLDPFDSKKVSSQSVVDRFVTHMCDLSIRVSYVKMIRFELGFTRLDFEELYIVKFPNVIIELTLCRYDKCDL